jgi:hypothetical protein
VSVKETKKGQTMDTKKIALGAFIAAGLIGSTPALAAEGMQVRTGEAMVNSRSPVTAMLPQPNKPMTTRLAESCDDNWWEFSLFQAIGCALRDDDDDDGKKPEFLDQELWDRYYGD